VQPTFAQTVPDALGFVTAENQKINETIKERVLQHLEMETSLVPGGGIIIHFKKMLNGREYQA
jgi:hypothetical protein